MGISAYVGIRCLKTRLESIQDQDFMYILVASLQMKSGLSVYAAKFRRRQG